MVKIRMSNFSGFGVENGSIPGNNSSISFLES